ncbi:hypothetical protein CVT24_005216 [Panaeolus cyanescens]|uniref:HNH nuclease domain-containing protein n=1 Tax=Panaeolus cyanescens TaxID=181874 RepID=A0A409Y9H6_9AGAR|nr:hypothetical protein CVT24_005216 [Panaeolus cyanescens]
MADSSTPPARTGAATDSETAKKLAARDRAVAIRVKLIAPMGNRCIIEHRANSSLVNLGIDLCHCFGRANSFDDEMMMAIEFRWGLECGSLSLDSRWNCFPMSSHFHRMYDGGVWGMVPSLKTLKAYEDATREDLQNEEEDRVERNVISRSTKLRDVMQADSDKIRLDIDPVDGADRYHVYSLLAFNPEMAKTVILRYHKDIPLRKSDVTLYTYPFHPKKGQSLQIKSHLHPKFVILSLGQQLAKEDHITDILRAQSHVTPAFDKHLEIVEYLYGKWTKELTKEQRDDTIFPKFIPTPVAKSKYDREGPSYHPRAKSGMSGDPGSRPRTRSVSRREFARTPSPMGNIPRVSPDVEDGQADGEKTDGECDEGSDVEWEEDDHHVEQQGEDEGDDDVEEQGEEEGDDDVEEQEQEEVGAPFPEGGNANDADYQAASSPIQLEKAGKVRAWGQGIKRDASFMMSSSSNSESPPFPSSPTGPIESVGHAEVPVIEDSSRRGRSPAKKKVRSSAN